MRRLAVRVAWTVALAVLVSCGGKPAGAPAGRTVGVTLLTRAHLFYRDLEQGLRDEASKRGIDLVVTSADFDLGKQTSQIEDFVARRVDAIVVCPVDSRGVGPAIGKANGAGIPVFTADIAAEEGRVVCHVASDNVAGGRLAGEYLASQIGGTGKVAVINQPAITSVLDRVQGFREAVATHPGMEIVADVNGQGVRDKAFEAASDVLQAHPDLRGIFGINDDSALGALDAVRQLGREGIVLVGYDATEPAVDAIRNGTALRADVVQNPKLIGTTTIRIIADHFAGAPVPARVPVEVAIADRASLGSSAGGAPGRAQESSPRP